MIRFKTQNSEYRVMVLHGKFHVTKIAVINPDSTYMAVGQTHFSNRMLLQLGCCALFDDLHTSRVVWIADSHPVKEGIC